YRRHLGNGPTPAGRHEPGPTRGPAPPPTSERPRNPQKGPAPASAAKWPRKPCGAGFIPADGGEVPTSATAPPPLAGIKPAPQGSLHIHQRPSGPAAHK